MDCRTRRMIPSLLGVVVVVAAMSFPVLNGSTTAVEPTAPSEVSQNLAYNPAGSGYPHPLESDQGWGGGAKPWDIVDGRRTYPDEWARGLAFTGGEGSYIELCGWRQATIDLGEPTTFSKVVVWHHGLGHVPNTYKIQYWSGTDWVDVFSTVNGHAYLKYPADPPTNWWEHWSTPTENTFPPVTSNKVRLALNNCDIEHGWIYAFEVYYEGHYGLAISSTAGGSVTTPGEGTFVYEEGTVVDLVAEAEEGHGFVNWTGDISTIADIGAASTTATVNGYYSMKANFIASHAGIEAGDWIKIKYEITGWPAGQPRPEWLKCEFLSIEGTSATVLVTMRMSDGTEQSETVPLEIGESGGAAFGIAGLVIPANLTKGDTVHIAGYGNVVIEGETTRSYAGARRRVVHTSFSEYGVSLTYYWDKQTGVMVEASTAYAGTTATARATETNMWESDPVVMQWWLWVIIGVGMAAAAFAVHRLTKAGTKKTMERREAMETREPVEARDKGTRTIWSMARHWIVFIALIAGIALIVLSVWQERVVLVAVGIGVLFLDLIWGGLFLGDERPSIRITLLAFAGLILLMFLIGLLRMLMMYW